MRSQKRRKIGEINYNLTLFHQLKCLVELCWHSEQCVEELQMSIKVPKYMFQLKKNV